MEKTCPCHSGLDYEKCCKRFHISLEKPTPVELMRSRYSAYALSDVNYIIKTTHKNSPHFDKKLKRWAASILEFCKSTNFLGLEILSSSIENDQAYVTFFATLKQQERDASYTEKSTFKCIDGNWLYLNGVSESGLATKLV